jgi:hypothetical protein
MFIKYIKIFFGLNEKNFNIFINNIIKNYYKINENNNKENINNQEKENIKENYVYKEIEMKYFDLIENMEGINKK